jgi:hypothetical protein
MRLIYWLPFLCVLGCGGRHDGTLESGECSAGQIPVYSNRFTPQAGASGVATAVDAENGMTSSQPNTPISSTDPSVTAMTVTCGQANCAAGQVAVQIPGKPSGGPGGPSSSAAGVDSATGAPSSGDSTPTPGTTVCADPPPDCPQGESPQYTMKQTWECTDCTLVVTYGGEYGNYRRCVGKPDVTCQQGQVPTWVYQDEQWECQPTCDNGQYDQHIIAGELVCVPC